MADGELAIGVAGEELLLLPERAAFWPRASTLLIADVHWGKAAAFRAAGYPVPEDTTHDGLARLERLARRHKPERIVYLGDYLHAAEGRVMGTLAALRQWGERFPNIEQVLVRGNHDRGAGDPPPDLGIQCVDAPLLEPPFSLRHYPTSDADGYVLAGHLHPAVRLVGPGRQRARFRCFWIQEECAVLPSFGAFTGSADVQPTPDDGVYVIAGDRVVRVSGRGEGEL